MNEQLSEKNKEANNSMAEKKLHGRVYLRGGVNGALYQFPFPT